MKGLGYRRKFPAAKPWADPMSPIVVVGGSLLDAGNVFRRSGGSIPPSPPTAGVFALSY
jgi:hypothetical protein